MALADGYQEFCSLTCQEVPDKRFELQTCSFCFAVRPPVKGVGVSWQDQRPGCFTPPIRVRFSTLLRCSRPTQTLLRRTPMRDRNALVRTLDQIDGRGYPAYRQ